MRLFGAYAFVFGAVMSAFFIVSAFFLLRSIFEAPQQSDAQDWPYAILWLMFLGWSLPGVFPVKVRVLIALCMLAALIAGSLYTVSQYIFFPRVDGRVALRLTVASILTVAVAPAFMLWLLLVCSGLRVVRAHRDSLFLAGGRPSSIRRPMSALRKGLLCPSYLGVLRSKRARLTVGFCVVGAMLGINAIVVYRALQIPYRVVLGVFPQDPNALASWSVDRLWTALGAVGRPAAIKFEAAVCVFFLCKGLAGFVFMFAQRRTAAEYQQVRDWDDRPPILFLRAFRQDNKPLDTRHDGLLNRMFSFSNKFLTLDALLLDVASPYGPVIAIGQPGESLPPLGAARQYVTGDGWREVVDQLMTRARFIIVCVDDTDGIAWEIERLVVAGHLEKTMFLANPLLKGELLPKVLLHTAKSEDARELVPTNGDLLNNSASGEQIPIAVTVQDAGRLHVTYTMRLWVGTYWCAINECLLSELG